MRGIYNTSKKEGYKHPRKESVKERPSWLSWRFNAHSMKLAKVSDGESENENPIMAELLPTDEGVFCQTQHLYRNGAGVGISQYFHKSPIQIYVTIFWERPTSALKKP